MSPTSLRLIFFGTPAFAVPSLDRLAASRHEVVGVVTQPDRPRGRGQRLTPAPVKARALEHGLPVVQPDRLRTPETLAVLTALQADLAVVAAYGRILPEALLGVPRLGMINVHASLLPRWRGAAPVHRAILAGDVETGVTIMRVVQALDAGPMLAARATPIDPAETSAELEVRLADLGATLLIDVVDRLADGPVSETPQDERLVTYAARLERGESPLDWRLPATQVHDRIRGLQPWPQASSGWHGRRVVLKRSRLPSASEDGTSVAPGTIAAIEADGLLVGTGMGLIRVESLQMEGAAPVDARAWASGQRARAGDRFDPLPERS